ncbi:MAG: BolA family transcriptional regulator [Nitrosomonadales bacterium]|jgi:BolA protein|nr:MAG: BolA family transcriptional regulator [Nitrosomonadales bacterium]
MSTIKLIKQKLAALSPDKIEILDESARHIGHKGAKSGGGHFILTIVSCNFYEKSTMARHKMIYAALGEMMSKDIHALSIKAYTPEEI